MKKLLIVLFGASMLLSSNVYAMENEISYYTNENNVSLNEKEYDFISDMFYEGYQDIMDSNDYERIFCDKQIVNEQITSNTYSQDMNSNIAPFATLHETGSKRLTISKVCTTDCLITIKVLWTASPTIRSYDVIGTYLDNVKLLDSPITRAIGDDEISVSNEIVQSSKGFGVSVKLPSTGNGMSVMQYFRVSGNGTVYGSYQHAKKNISLANSKKYTISKSGYGGVFLFDSAYRSYYDGMSGVDISVNI